MSVPKRVTLHAYLVTNEGRTNSLKSVKDFQLAITSTSTASELLASLCQGLKLPESASAPTAFDGCKDVRHRKDGNKVTFMEKVRVTDDEGEDSGTHGTNNSDDSDSDSDDDLDANKPWFETKAKSPVLSIIREGINVASEVRLRRLCHPAAGVVDMAGRAFKTVMHCSREITSQRALRRYISPFSFCTDTHSSCIVQL